MKNTIIVFIALLISISTFAQQGINYKAILKDADGNALSETPMTVQFTIHETSATGPAVYQEEHPYTTDVNGLLILTIGTGTTPIEGIFATIDWSAKRHFLRISIGYSGGNIFFDPTEFMAVPYAKHAEIATTAENVSTKIDDLTDGKSDTNGSSLFIGVEAGLNDDGSDNKNVGIGYRALNLNTTGNSNTALGRVALRKNNTGSQNTAIGYSAMQDNTSGYSNTAIGFDALGFNDTGFNNTAIGENALLGNSQGYNNTATGAGALYQNRANNNTAYGYNAMYVNWTGGGNTANGVDALYSNFSGDRNTASGHAALRANTGDSNTATGYEALWTNDNGNHNTATGRSALRSNTTGNSNTAIGLSAGRSNTSGNSNIFIGANSGSSINSGSNDKLYIDNSSTVDPLIYGEFDTNLVRINGVLDVTGDIQAPIINVTGEIQTPSTGNANMIPIAYGTVNSAGTILSGTGNFTVDTTFSPTLYIEVTGETLSHTNSSTLVTPLSGAFRTSGITHSNGDVRVHIFNSSGTQIVNTFQFVIYRI